MRIISQDGCYDIPYESIILQRLGTSIFGVTTGLQESVTIARYRKEEKAIKAMKMCREQYAENEFNKELIPSDSNVLTITPDGKVESENERFKRKYVFQFPADEEVE